MSSKVNIVEILTGHIQTLSDRNGKIIISDIFVFYFLPFSFAVASTYFSLQLDKDITSLLVNFGSIFTALLLSVLVLVYDQESKVEQIKATDSMYSLKKSLLRDLYYNISYSILCSLFLVLLCFLHSIINGSSNNIDISIFHFTIKYSEIITVPLIVFITSNLFLNILMIVKRLHALLITHH